MANCKRKSFKKGTLVEVIANHNGNDYTIGEIYRVLRSAGETIECESLDGNWEGNHLRKTDCEIVGLTVEHFQQELAELKSKMDAVQSTIDWMRETGAEEYDETEHKVWSVMNAVEDGSLSKLEKVKAIAKLVKG